MLVLSRRNHESIVIGGSGAFEGVLRVTVVDIRDGVVKLGIEADPDVPVHRSEVWERIWRPSAPPVRFLGEYGSAPRSMVGRPAEEGRI